MRGAPVRPRAYRTLADISTSQQILIGGAFR
jgi:hypothetical protein